MRGGARTRVLALGMLLLAAGCSTDNKLEIEGVSFGAGNAIAANTVMQMVDPWPRNAQYTDLTVPADRERYRRRGGGAETPEIGAAADGEGSRL